MTITVKQPTEIPYGVFSNAYRSKFLLDGKEWESVIQYMTNIKGVQYDISAPYEINYMNLWDYLEKELTNKAIQKAIDIKSRSDKKFEGILLSTGSRPLIYKSNNTYLGVNNEGVGENVYGKWLTNYRNIISENNPEVFYDIYVLNRLLSIAIFYEPLDDYLKLAREGAGIRYLNQLLYSKYRDMIDMPSRATVEDLRQITKKSYPTNAENIILDVMKNKLRSVRAANIKSFKYKVFTEFVERVYKKHNIRSDLTPAMFISRMPIAERDINIDRIYSYYLNLKEKPFVHDVYIPSEKEVTKAEQETYIGTEHGLKINMANAIEIDSVDSPLNMVNTSSVLNIDNKNFPTIFHYVSYVVGGLIENYDPYSLITDGQQFYSVEKTKELLTENLQKYKKFFNTKIVPAINSKINYNPYIIDILKTVPSDENIIIRDLDPRTTSGVYRDIRERIPYSEILQYRGRVIDVIDTDSFFVYTQYSMLSSFVDILNIVNPGDYRLQNVQKIYQTFFSDSAISGQNVINEYSFHDPQLLINMSKDLNISLHKDSAIFLKNKFCQKILTAEFLANKRYRTDSFFMTKLLITDVKRKIALGEFNNPNIRYNSYESKVRLALTILVNYIANATNYMVATKEQVEKAAQILTSNFYKKTLTPAVVIKDQQEKNNYLIVENEDEMIYEQPKGYIDEGDEDVNIDYCDENCRTDHIELDEGVGFEDERNEDVQKEIVSTFNENAETSDYEDFNDLVYGSDEMKGNADVVAKQILKSLNADKEVYKFIDIVSKNLENVNCYRLNLWL